MSRFDVDNIEIRGIDVSYDRTTHTTTKETPTLLQYESQHFQCSVTLRFTQSVAHQNWSVGLVQACDHMYLENRYGDTGSSFWEFHPLRCRRRKMVNDSDGRQYPFYSLTSSKCEVRRGFVPDTTITLRYEDHFYPTVAWELLYCSRSKLTDIIRLQDFWVWLVAIKRGTIRDNCHFDVFSPNEDSVYVLKTMRWRYNLHLSFDPLMPLGKRLKHVADVQHEQPYVLDSEREIPISALCPPHCNAAQSLVWYPTDKTEPPRILVPPKQVIVPWDQWLTDMTPNGSLRANRPKDCKVVSEFLMDDSVGLNKH
jgi:hypothetical protein